MYDDCGYDPSDPKHPTWHERQCDHADEMRKMGKEEPINPHLVPLDEDMKLDRMSDRLGEDL